MKNLGSDLLKTDNKKPEIKTTNQKSAKKENENKEYAEYVVLKAVGYPFDFNLMENDFEINNKKLFEEYAREQWLGLEVNEKSYLFDQKIIPDYGFEIITAKPNGSIISEKTKIKLVDTQTSKLNDEIKFDSTLKLSDIVGQKNAKNKVKVLIKYLENPEKF